jgi:hypothetical protein
MQAPIFMPRGAPTAHGVSLSDLGIRGDRVQDVRSPEVSIDENLSIYRDSDYIQCANAKGAS